MSVPELKDAIRAYEKEHSKLPERIEASVPVKYKLPAEGQPGRSRRAGPSSLQDVSGVDADEDSPSTSRQGGSSSGANDEDKVRYWEPGWYLWSTTSRWATQEQMDMMSKNLKWQSDWQKYKANVNDNHKKRQGKGEDEVDDKGKERVKGPRVRQSFPDLTCAKLSPPDAPFTNFGLWCYSENTWLVPVPPPHLLLGNAIENYMIPTFKLMALVRGTFDDGRQQELCARMWEKAQTREPWIVAQSAVRKVWKILSEGPPVDEEGEERNKRGNSSS